jgi:hypothetical protein
MKKRFVNVNVCIVVDNMAAVRNFSSLLERKMAFRCRSHEPGPVASEAVADARISRTVLLHHRAARSVNTVRAVKAAVSLKLTTRLNLVLWLGMRGFVPPPHCVFVACCLINRSNCAQWRSEVL